MSKGVPPPNSTAQLLGMYAGSINQIAVIVAVISGIIVLLFGSRIPSHIYLIIRAPEGEGLSSDNAKQATNPKFESRNLTEARLSSSHMIEGNHALRFFTTGFVCSAPVIINSKNMILSPRVSIFIILWAIIKFMLKPREPG